MAISKLQRRNKNLAQDEDYVASINDTIPTIEKVYYFVKEQTDGATFGEIYKNFPFKTPRYVREMVKTLKDRGDLTLTKCRCNGATIYYVHK